MERQFLENEEMCVSGLAAIESYVLIEINFSGHACWRWLTEDILSRQSRKGNGKDEEEPIRVYAGLQVGNIPRLRVKN
eukprot:8337845-Karenia_brevis.AAC.1